MCSDVESAAVGGMFFGALIGCVIGVFVHVGMYGSTDMGILQHQQTAIDAGHAEWIVDQKTGERAFKWKTAPEMDWADDEEEAPK